MSNNFFKKVPFFVFLLCLIVCCLFVFQLFSLNVLPGSILVVGCVFLAVLILLSFVLSLKWKIIGNVLMVLILCISSIGNVYLYKTQSLFGSVTDNESSTSSFSVVCLKDYSDSISSLGILSIGNLELQDAALKELSSEYDYVEFDSYKRFGSALYDGMVDSLLVSDSSFALLEEEFPSFRKDIKVVETFKVHMKSSSVSKNVNIVKDPFVVYISGHDAEDIDSNISRSDVNIVMMVNPNTHQILMLGIPRDFYILQVCQNNQKDKLTHTGMYGTACTVESVENFMNVPVNYYVEVNFNSLVNVVDALDGITVNSPYEFKGLYKGYYYNKGPIELDGDYALGFVRERYSFTDGDRERSRNQMRVLTAIINKSMSPMIITKYPSLMDSLSSSFKTNMSQKEITTFIKTQLKHMEKWDIQQIQVNGTVLTTVSPALGFEVYMMEPNMDTVEHAEKLIKKVLNNEVVTESDVERQNELVSNT